MRPARSPRATAVRLAAMLLAVMAAGCGGKDGPTRIEVAPGQVIEVEEAPAPTEGIVAGVVANDALYPIEGVRIRIVGLPLEASTDAAGRFAIPAVPAGIYIVEGAKKDHATVQATVDVQPGKVAKAILLLPRIPATDPYHITWGKDVFVEAYAVVVGTRLNATLSFTFDASRPVTVVLESLWNGTVLSADEDWLEYHVDRLDGSDVLNDRTVNPMLLHLDARVLPWDEPELRFTVTPDPARTVTFQGRGSTYATVFYNQPAPAGWSVVGGSS